MKYSQTLMPCSSRVFNGSIQVSSQGSWKLGLDISSGHSIYVHYSPQWSQSAGALGAN